MGIFNIFGGSKKTQTMSKVAGKPEKNIDYSASGSINRYYPRSFDDVAKIIDVLLSGDPVIINVTALENRTAQRVLDLMSGALYAINGNMCELEKEIYLFTPKK